MIIKPEVNEEIEKKLDDFESSLNELKAKMSELRKKGKDTFFAEQLFLESMPLIKMTKITYENDDVEKIQKLIDDIREELKISETGSRFERALDLIREINDCIRDNDFKKANSDYIRLMDIYKELSDELRKYIFSACMAIHKRLMDK